MTLNRLRQWAEQCRLTAGNLVSRDRDDWVPVQEWPALEMDWTARRPDGREYGPFNIRAAPELFRHGVLPAEAILHNERTAESINLREALDHLGAEGVGPALTTPPGSDAPTPAEAPAPAFGQPDEAAQPATPSTAALPDAHGEVERLQAECDRARQDAERQAAMLEKAREQHAHAYRSLQEDCARVESELRDSIAQLQARRAQDGDNLKRLGSEIDATTHQLAFLKKNNALLLQDIEQKARLVRRLIRLCALALALLAGLLTAWLRHTITYDHGQTKDRATPVLPTDESLLPGLLQRRMTADPTPPQPASGHGIAPGPALGGDLSDRMAAPDRQVVEWPDFRIDGVVTKITKDTLILIFEEPVFSRLTVLSDWGRTVLGSVSRALAPVARDFKVTIEGHTDNLPLSPDSVFESNDHLGLVRAEVVVAFLTTVGGIPPEALRPVSLGSRSPPYPNDAPASRRRNRTVVLRLQPALTIP